MRLDPPTINLQVESQNMFPGGCVRNDPLTWPVELNPITIPTPQNEHEFIELSDGSLFFPKTAKTFTIHTIAHSAAMACRFGGQCRDFYSVAQHGVLVSHLMAHIGGDPFEGLMHDASESIMLDMPTPIKKMLPDYKALENDLLGRIRVFYGLPAAKTALCDKADKLALFIEAYDLIPSQGTTFSDPLNVRDLAFELRPKFEHLVVPLNWKAAKYQFLKRFKELSGVESNTGNR